MEEELTTLIDATTEANRKSMALEWKKQGKPVIGIMSSYVPEEVITAAGMLPWRIAGTWREDLEAARVYRGDSTCSYCNHVLELFLNGELDFLDGVIVTDLDQDLLRLWDLLVYLKKPSFNYAIHVPFVDSRTTRGFFTDEISRMIDAVQAHFKINISETALNSAIETHNKTRSLLRHLYELRKRDIPPLSGTEVLGIASAAEIMPKAAFNQTIESLMPYIEERRTSLGHLRPRLLITGESLDNPAYLKLVEEQCIIVMDDTDTGSRSFTENVESGTADPVRRLAARYLSRPGDPRMIDWDKQVDQIIQWVKDYNADGVLALPLIWCYPQRYRMPYLFHRLDEVGIPHASLEREYHLTNAGQLRTRIGAFLEMLDSRQHISTH